MLELIFGSELKAACLKFFINNPLAAISTKDLIKRLGSNPQKVLAELASLEKLGFLERLAAKEDSAWKLAPDFPLINEMRALLFKSLVLLEHALVRKVQHLKGISLLLFTGVFIGQAEIGTDILLVGSMDKKAVNRIMNIISEEFGQDLRFTVFTKAEFNERRGMTDKFIYEIINSNPIVAIDNM